MTHFQQLFHKMGWSRSLYCIKYFTLLSTLTVKGRTFCTNLKVNFGAVAMNLTTHLQGIESKSSYLILFYFSKPSVPLAYRQTPRCNRVLFDMICNQGIIICYIYNSNDHYYLLYDLTVMFMMAATKSHPTYDIQ